MILWYVEGSTKQSPASLLSLEFCSIGIFTGLQPRIPESASGHGEQAVISLRLSETKV